MIRALRPGGPRDHRRSSPTAPTVELEQIHPGGVFEGMASGEQLPLRYRLEDRLRRLGHVHDRRPVLVPADARRARPAPDRRGPPRGALQPARRARARAGRRSAGGRHGVRGVGAVGAGGQRGRRLQLLGRPPARDAHARLDRDLGAVPPRRRPGRPLQVRDPRRRRRADAEGRPVRAGGRDAAEDGIGRDQAQPPLERRRRAVAARARGTPSRCSARCRSTRSTSGRGG